MSLVPSRTRRLHSISSTDKGRAGCFEAKTGKRFGFEELRERSEIHGLAGNGRRQDLCGQRRRRNVCYFAAEPKLQLPAWRRTRSADRIRTSPAVADGRIYLRDTKHLYLFWERRIEWLMRLDSPLAEGRVHGCGAQCTRTRRRRDTLSVRPRCIALDSHAPYRSFVGRGPRCPRVRSAIRRFANWSGAVRRVRPISTFWSITSAISTAACSGPKTLPKPGTRRSGLGVS